MTHDEKYKEKCEIAHKIAEKTGNCVWVNYYTLNIVDDDGIIFESEYKDLL
jgi:hypothetical protein